MKTQSPHDTSQRLNLPVAVRGTGIPSIGGTDQLLFANHAAAMHKLIDRYQFRKRNTTNRRLSTCTYSRTHKRANAWTRRDFGGKSRHITQPVRAYRPKPVSGRIGHEICVPMEAAKGPIARVLGWFARSESRGKHGACGRMLFPASVALPHHTPGSSPLSTLVLSRPSCPPPHHAASSRVYPQSARQMLATLSPVEIPSSDETDEIDETD